MSTIIRPELSSKNRYHISKNRYYELKYMCLQYAEMKKTYNELEYKTGSYISTNSDVEWTDRVGDIASRKADIKHRINLIEHACELTDPLLAPYILKSVTEGFSYTYLQTVMCIPCCRNTYYDRYRKFFYVLDKFA